MKKTDTKSRLLAVGARIIRTKGYNFVGLKEILEEAGVPKGSFYFHFKNKEDFGLRIVDIYGNYMYETLKKHFETKGKSTLIRLKRFFEEYKNYLIAKDFTEGSPLGNLCIEMADLNQAFRLKIEEQFQKITSLLIDFLNEAKKNQELSDSFDAKTWSEFLMNSWEGTVLRSKSTKSEEPINLFLKIWFENLLIK